MPDFFEVIIVVDEVLKYFMFHARLQLTTMCFFPCSYLITLFVYFVINRRLRKNLYFFVG